MKKIIICLFYAFAHFSFSQSETVIGIGVQFSTVLETNMNNGVIPAFSLSYKQHECVFGTRFGFQQMNNLVNRSGEKKLIVNPDFVYRYFIRIKSQRIRPYVSVLFNYYHNYKRTDRYYTDWMDEQTVLYGPVFDHSFNLREESVTKSCGLYLAPGVEIRMWKKLFFQISGGPGLIWKKSHEIYTNLDSGQTEAENRVKWSWINDCYWFGTAGLGYRF